MFEQFRNLPLNRQIMLLASATVLIAIVLFAVWLAFLRVPYLPLYTGLRTEDAATIVADLDRNRIPYQLSDGGATVLVPADKLDATRLNVSTTDLPLKGTVGFELFNKSDLGLTDFAEKINYQRALQGELERTIMALDGVDTARVHLSLGEDRLFREDRAPPKASVSIRMRKGERLSDSAAQGIKRLVSAAVQQLDAANVVILDETGRMVGAEPAVAPPGTVVSPAMEEKHSVEEYYEAKIRQALDQDFGVGVLAVHVSANVTIQPNGEGFDGNTTGTEAATGRNFGLAIAVSSRTAMSPASEDSVRGMVTRAVGSSNAGQDEITFEVSPDELTANNAATPGLVQPATVPAAPVSIDATGPAPSNEPSAWLWEAFAATIPVALVVLVLLLLRRARTPRLSEQQRADFAAKLRSALAQEPGHAS